MQATLTLAVVAALIGGTALWVWALADVLSQPHGPYRNGNQVVWAVVIALTHAVGAALYLVLGRARATSPVASDRPRRSSGLETRR